LPRRNYVDSARLQRKSYAGIPGKGSPEKEMWTADHGRSQDFFQGWAN